MNSFKISTENLERILNRLNNECRIFRESKIELIENTGPCFSGAISGAIRSSSDCFLNYLDLERNFEAPFAEIYEFGDVLLLEIDEEKAKKLGIFYTVAGQLRRYGKKLSQDDEASLLIRKQQTVYMYN